MSTVVELMRLYFDLGMSVALFFFGRTTKDTEEVLIPAIVAFALGMLWPWVIWHALRNATSSKQAAPAAANYKDPS